MIFVNRICPNIEKVFPNQTPIIYSLSQYSSNQGEYTVIYITGENFVYGNSKNGNSSKNTEVIMISNNGTGEKTIIQTTYYSSNNISFVVPVNFSSGIYKLYVSVKSTITGGSSAAVSGVSTILFSNNVFYNIV